MAHRDSMQTYKLANRLKEMRARADLTQGDLASAAGVTRKTVNTVENRVFTPSTLLALKFAKVLNVSVDELFYLELPNH